MQVMKWGGELHELAVAGLLALGHMVRNEGLKDIIQEAGAATVVHETMAKHRDNVNVQGAGLKALMELAQGSATLAARDGTSAACEALISHQSHPGVVRDAVFTLYLLSPGIADGFAVWSDPDLKVKVLAILEAVLVADSVPETLRKDASAVLEVFRGLGDL